jgi:hypothetical protein
VPTREEFERLLIAATNATFDCGAFDETERRPFDASISAYEQVAAIAKERRAAVLAAWDALEATATEREADTQRLNWIEQGGQTVEPDGEFDGEWLVIDTTRLSVEYRERVTTRGKSLRSAIDIARASSTAPTEK